MKSKITWLSIIVFGVILFGLPAAHAADDQYEPADSEFEPDFADVDVADDEVFDDDFKLGDLDELVYAPVKPCRIFDTRNAGGPIPTFGTRAFWVHGDGMGMASQGGNPAGCPAPRGEPRAVHINIAVDQPIASGYLTVWPTGTARPLSGVLNFKPTYSDPISNAFTVKTGFNINQDIFVYAFRQTHVIADVMGYYYDVDETDTNKYVTLAGGQCNLEPNNIDATYQLFYCDLSDGGDTFRAYWDVNVPNGATLRGMRVRLYTGAGTTTCRLRYGNNNFGTIIATVTDSTSGWHFTPETTFTHTVNTASNAYGVECINGTAGDNAIGSIRIRYTSKAPY